MRLIITRHGETEGNVKRLLADANDSLTPKGREQAEKVSERLKEENIGVIFSSPLARAKQTAQIIEKNQPQVEFIIADELKEMELGSYLNRGYDDVDWDNMPSDVESRTSLYRRAELIFEKALENYPRGTVLFVSHNAMNKAIIRFLRGWSPEDKRAIPQDNTAITIFEISNKENKEMMLNSTSHLE